MKSPEQPTETSFPEVPALKLVDFPPPQPPRLAYMEAYQTQFQQVWLSDFPAH